MVTLKFGVCMNCSHEVVYFGDQWKHHITRATLHHVPHWPTGHVITLDCKRDCQCSIPDLDRSKEQKQKLFSWTAILTGRRIDSAPQCIEVS